MDSEDLLEELQEGDVKKALARLDVRTVKTLLNVIRNVIDNPTFKECITPEHKKILKPYHNTFAKLLDDQLNLSEKRKLLQKDGDKYLPTFLDIIGDELENCIPRKVNRKRKDCPVCGKENLLKLSNHLKEVHHIDGEKRKNML